MAPPPAKGSSTRGARPPKASRMSIRAFSRSGLSPSCTASQGARLRMRCRNSSRFLPSSGKSAASVVAREAARGRRAHQMWRVEMCPWRIFFSRTDSSETFRRGKSASMRCSLFCAMALRVLLFGYHTYFWSRPYFFTVATIFLDSVRKKTLFLVHDGRVGLSAPGCSAGALPAGIRVGIIPRPPYG